MDDDLERKIDSYLKGDDKRPLVIDIGSINIMQELSLSRYLLKEKNVLSLAKNECEIPSMSDIYEFMETCVLDHYYVCLVLM